MPSIRIRVGAALDASLASVLRSVGDAAKKASKQVASEGEKAGKATGAAYRGGADEAIKAIKAADREAQKQAREAARLAKKSADEQVRIEKAKNRELDRERKKNANEEERSFRDRQRKVDKMMSGAISTGATMGRSALSFGKRFAGDVIGGLGIQSNVGDRLSDSIRRETLATQISNSAYQPGAAGAAGKRVDPRVLQAEANQVGMQTATSSEDALKGLQAFVGLTGDLKTGRDILSDMAIMSKATGSSLEDMVDAGAQVSNVLGDIPDKGQAITQVMRVFAGQGQVGAVEIKDMASQMAKLAAQALNFKIDPRTAAILEAKGVNNATGQNLAVMGAMAQAARAQGGRATAATSVQSSMAFVRDLSSRAELKRMSAAGIDVFADKGKTTAKDPVEIIKAIFNKTHGATPDIANLMPNQNSRAIVNAFGQDYKRAANATTRDAGMSDAAYEQKRNAAGLKAIGDAYDRYLTVAMDAPEIMLKFNAAMGTTESKVQLFNNHMGQTADRLRDELLPALVALTPVIVQVSQKLADTIGRITGVTDKNRQETTLGIERNAIHNVHEARNAITQPGMEDGVPMRPFSMVPTEVGGDVPGNLGKSKAEIDAAMRGLEQERARIKATIPESKGGTMPETLFQKMNGGRSGAGFVLAQADKDRLATIEKEMTGLGQEKMSVEKMQQAFKAALENGEIVVKVSNMPTGGKVGNPFGPGAMPVESAVGL